MPTNNITMTGPWHGIACRCEPGTHASHCPTKTDQPILALASAANAAANRFRAEIDAWTYTMPCGARELLAAVDALTTAITDAEA